MKNRVRSDRRLRAMALGKRVTPVLTDYHVEIRSVTVGCD